jgi:hypothetical protein
MAQKCDPTFITTFEPIDVCPLCVEQNCHGPQFVTTTMRLKIWSYTLPFILDAVSLRATQPFSCRPIKTISIMLSVTVPFYAAFDITRKRCFSPAPQFCKEPGIYTSHKTAALTLQLPFPVSAMSSHWHETTAVIRLKLGNACYYFVQNLLSSVCYPKS